MLEGIKEIGIFLVIAQAVLYFVPGESYEKYVKVIVGVIMIALTAHSVLGLVTGEKGEEIRLSSKEMQEILEKEPELFGLESSKVISKGVTKELEEYEKENEMTERKSENAENTEAKSGKEENGSVKAGKEENGSVKAGKEENAEAENEKIVIEKNKVNKITTGGKEQTLQ